MSAVKGELNAKGRCYSTSRSHIVYDFLTLYKPFRPLKIGREVFLVMCGYLINLPED
jgi:hypothetical protein